MLNNMGKKFQRQFSRIFFWGDYIGISGKFAKCARVCSLLRNDHCPITVSLEKLTSAV